MQQFLPACSNAVKTNMVVKDTEFKLGDCGKMGYRPARKGDMPYEIQVTWQIWSKKIFTRESDFLVALEKVKTVLLCFIITNLE